MKVDESKLTPAELRYYKHYLACEKSGIPRKDYCDQNGIKASTFSHYIGTIKRKSEVFKPRKYDTGAFKKVDVKDTSNLCSLAIGDLKVEFPVDSRKLARLLEVVLEKC